MAYFGRLACAAIVLALAVPVHAAPSGDEARATELKKQGDDLVHASKFLEALKKYDESFAIVPNPAIHYNRGRAFESLEDWPAALDAFDKFVATAPADLKSRAPNLDKTMAEIASHVATLVIKCEVAGAAVTVRGKPEGTTPMPPFRTLGGDATITVTAPGYVVFTQDTTLPAGQSTTVDVTLRKVAADQATADSHEPTPFDKDATPTPTQDKVTSGGHGGLRTFAWVIGGVGLVSAGVGATFFGLSLADKSSADPHCPNKVCDATGRKKIDEAWTFATVSTVLVVVGAVALATSVMSFILSPKRAPVEARLFITPGSAGIGGTF